MDKAALLKGFLPEGDVELPSGTGAVRVRGLSRVEAVQVQTGLEETDVDELEIRAIARGMLDPKMTEDDVRTWREVTAAADLQAVAKRISELSNLDAQAPKGPTSRSKGTRR
jgi:hypothetical protein